MEAKEKRTNAEKSRSAIVSLSKNAAYARDSTGEDTTAPIFSREVAYAILAMLHAERVGEPRRGRLKKLVEQAIGHLEILLPAELPKSLDQVPYTRPFMVGITARALIEYAEVTKDPRVRPLLTNVAERLWSRMWVEESQAFLYSNRKFPDGVVTDDCNPAPDLNLMIAPLYAWVGLTEKRGESFMRADKIMRGALDRAYWDGAKQYNQLGWWSFDGIAYRAGGTTTSVKSKVAAPSKK